MQNLYSSCRVKATTGFFLVSYYRLERFVVSGFVLVAIHVVKQLSLLRIECALTCKFLSETFQFVRLQLLVLCGVLVKQGDATTKQKFCDERMKSHLSSFFNAYVSFSVDLLSTYLTRNTSALGKSNLCSLQDEHKLMKN